MQNKCRGHERNKHQRITHHKKQQIKKHCKIFSFTENLWNKKPFHHMIVTTWLFPKNCLNIFNANKTSYSLKNLVLLWFLIVWVFFVHKTHKKTLNFLSLKNSFLKFTRQRIINFIIRFRTQFSIFLMI